MFDDAVKSLRTLFLTSITLLLLWFVTWPSTTAMLPLFRATADLTAWAAMRDALVARASDVLAMPADADVTSYTTFGEPRPPNDNQDEIAHDLAVTVTWPEARIVPFTLVHADQFDPGVMTLRGTVARVYRISCDAAALQVCGRYAAFLQDTTVDTDKSTHEVIDVRRLRVGIIRPDFPQFRIRGAGTRQVELALERADAPDGWQAVALSLQRLEFDGDSRELSASSGALKALQAEADPRRRTGVTAFGVQLSIVQFLSSIGLLLAVIGFAMIGPLLALKSDGSRTHSQSWVLALPGSTRGARRILDWVATAFTLTWALAPVAVLVMQRPYASELRSLSADALVYGSAIGLVFATVVYVLVAIELRRLRRASPPALAQV